MTQTAMEQAVQHENELSLVRRYDYANESESENENESENESESEEEKEKGTDSQRSDVKLRQNEDSEGESPMQENDTENATENATEKRNEIVEEGESGVGEESCGILTKSESDDHSVACERIDL